MSFPTTLIIGLGGVGSRITLGIYKRFMSREPSQTDIDNFRCLCLDTDKNDIERYIQDIPKEYVIKTSSDLSFTVGQYINKIRDKSTVEEWFDVDNKELLKMKLDDGAGQIRMTSRLACMSAIADEKLKAIDNCIQQLLESAPERHDGNDIKVHIVCSLAGGTGAGSFLQTAYYVKHLMQCQHIDAPTITGYFVLGDILCRDVVAALDDTQKANVRANTYACIKELNAFTHPKESQLIKKIEFEYMFGQQDIKLKEEYAPYDHCYVIDYVGTDGSNIRDMEVYYNQVSDFLYLSAFSPMGADQRSKLINNTISEIRSNGAARYASFGVSKIVFPVDELYHYFAMKRLTDQLSATWVKIDSKFKEELEEYHKNLAKGIVTDEPKIGPYFIRNVDSIANDGSGLEQLVFKRLRDSTIQFDSSHHAIGQKCDSYLAAVEEYVNGLVDHDSTIKDQMANCVKPDRFNEDMDKGNDIQFIKKREEALENFKDYAVSFIESIKRTAIEQCFLIDSDRPNRVDMDVENTKHHLNTYILEKDHEMHPIAVRYFLYQVRDGINGKLSQLSEEVAKTKRLLDDYVKKYDQADDKKTSGDEKHIETATEAMDMMYKQQNLFNRGKVQEFRDIYLRESKKYRANILRYAHEKLLDYVLNGLKVEIGRLIEESENFFNRLPDTLRMIEEKTNDVLGKHDTQNSADPTVRFVLSSSKIKVHLYENFIKINDTMEFPNEISARIYCTMFDNTRIALEQNSTLGSLREEDEAAEELEKEQIEVNTALFEGVIENQERVLKKKEPKFVEMNVISALRMECELLYGKKAFDHMKDVFNSLIKLAVIRGAYNITGLNRYINAWGVNGECLKALSLDEQDKLFGASDVKTDPITAATREPNPFYSKYELVRANSVSLLEIGKNFKGFSKEGGNDLADGHVGSYREAYDKVNENILAGKPEVIRHLDKRWQLPAYMPNIGEDMHGIVEKIFKALCYGLLYEKFKVKHDKGEDYWQYCGDTTDFIGDFNHYPIALEGTENLNAGLDSLFERGLVDNPKIVEELTAFMEYEPKTPGERGGIWYEAKKEWQKADCSGSENALDMMKKHSLVKKIMEFDYGNVYAKWQNKNLTWFAFLNDNNSTALANMVKEQSDRFFEDFIEHLIGVFGPSNNTRMLCISIFEQISDERFKNDALQKVESFKNKRRFENKVIQ